MFFIVRNSRIKTPNTQFFKYWGHHCECFPKPNTGCRVPCSTDTPYNNLLWLWYQGWTVTTWSWRRSKATTSRYQTEDCHEVKDQGHTTAKLHLDWRRHHSTSLRSSTFPSSNCYNFLTWLDGISASNGRHESLRWFAIEVTKREVAVGASAR